jgi:hypothetical protein
VFILETSIEACQEGGSAQDQSRKILVPWTFDVKFPHDTQFTFGSLTFVAGEDGSLRMLPPRPTLERLASADGQAPSFLATSSTLGGACSGVESYAGLYICTGKVIQGISVVMSILRPSARASNSSSSAASPDQDWGKYLRGLRWGGSPDPPGGPSQGSIVQQLQQISHH